MARRSASPARPADAIPLSSIARSASAQMYHRAVVPPPSNKDLEFQHSVRDPLNLSSRLKPEAEIRANSSRKRAKVWRTRSDGVEDFYKGQNGTIRAMLKSVDEHEQEVKDTHGKNNLMYAVCVKGSLVANVALSALQLYAAISSGSLSLFVTMADSVFDPLSGFMLFMSHRAVDRVDPRRYPSGRARISTAGNIVFSFIMFSVSLVLIVMSARDLAAGSSDDTKDFFLPSVVAVAVAFGTKLTLFFMCWTIKDIYSQVDILWRDHRNDLFINGFGILTSVGGSKLRWWIDPAGAMVLSFLIGGLWLHTAYDEFQLLIGVTADRETLQLITYICRPFLPCEGVLKVSVHSLMRGSDDALAARGTDRHRPCLPHGPEAAGRGRHRNGPERAAGDCPRRGRGPADQAREVALRGEGVRPH